MKTFNDYLEMAVASETIDSWWNKNAEYAITYVSNGHLNDLLILMKIKPNSDEAQVFYDSTAKNQALQVANILGVKRFERMIKDWYVDDFTYDLNRDQCQDVIDDLYYDEYNDENFHDMDDSDARDRAGELLIQMSLSELTKYIDEKRNDWN